MEKTNNTPRGIRNNNPLNIRRTSTQWEGLHPVQADREFCQFIDMKYGYRAAFRLLMKYYRKYGLHSVQAIINRWAPPSDGNATNAYVKQVVNDLAKTAPGGVFIGPTSDIGYITETPMLWIMMVVSMTVVETGRNNINSTALLQGFALAVYDEVR